MRIGEFKLLHNITHHHIGGSGCKSKHIHPRKILTNVGYLKKRRTEIVAPLRNAVRFVDHNQAQRHHAKLVDKRFGGEPFRRHV